MASPLPVHPARPSTLAVVVSAGVSAYLPRTLAGIAGQTHAPDVVLVVDVGAPGRDLGTGIPVQEAVTDAGLEEVARVRVVRAPEAGTFGEAVRQGLVEYAALIERAARRAAKRPGGVLTGSHGGSLFGAGATGASWAGLTGELSPITSGEMRAVGAHGTEPDRQARPEWLWLLHDDSAPAPEALDRLLHAAESGRSVAIAGAKQRDWSEPDRLLEVGLRTTRSGRRVADIEPGEIDQGQHDHREDVLAVGTAGALVRLDVWTELGGTDPVLGPFGDGLDLSRRARLAGHRVVVVPTAVVFHARASLLGQRGGGVVRGASLAPEGPDPRRSFPARRRAQLHNALVAVPGALMPLLVVAFLVLAPVRALSRVATKEIGLAAAELTSVLAVLGRPRALWSARRRSRQARRIPARSLRPLQATSGEIRRAKRDVRRQAAAARRAAQAPSELEIAERAALAHRRRVTLSLLALLLVVVSLATYLPVVLSGALTGGALLPADATLADVWRAARSGWVTGGAGNPGPADPMMQVLAVAMVLVAPFGATANPLISALVVLAIPLAGVGAWFAAGAATRSVGLRAWAALVWALAPALLLGTGQGRLGAVVAHVMLPWVALGIARAVGVDRRDIILPGLAGAKRTALARSRERVAAQAAERAQAAGAAEGAGAAQTAGAQAAGAPAAAAAQGGVAPQGVATSGAVAVPTRGAAHGASAVGDADAPEHEASTAGHADLSRTDHTRSHAGSIAAAAGAGLALAVAAAGAPVLLPASVVLVLLLAVAVPRRRLLVLAVPLPALALLGPLLVETLRDVGAGSWRLLLADPGVAYASAPGAPWLAVLGWPARPPAFPGLDASAGGWLGWAAQHGMLAGGATLVLAALAAMLRGTRRGRAVRVGWVVAVVGIVAALAGARTDVAVGTGLAAATEMVRGWAGPGVSLAVLGLLVAAVSGGDGLRGALGTRSFGWRQVGAAALSVAAFAGPLVTAAGWLVAVRPGYHAPTELLSVHARAAEAVPAVAAEMQASGLRSRVLALKPVGDTVRAEVWRGPGAQLTGTSAAVAARELVGAPTARPAGEAAAAGSASAAGSAGAADAADAELAQAVAGLAVGAAQDPAAVLGEHAVGIVVVPPEATYVLAGAEPTTAARTELISRLDSTAGLERITENESGVIWRVARGEGEDTASSVARARVVDAEGAWVQDVAAGVVEIETVLPSGPEGRALVLAERADAGWHAWYDGRPLRATTDGWHQSFELPAHTGTLTVKYEPPLGAAWAWAQGIVLGLTLLLALPVRRRREVH
ncbi:glycosyltransferase [Georgenia sp. SYP-B2076]|uniref:glycosyltransferase n=1 Tax=Georgenia sp. SYP-B2076 TaxID=2495881 RepID=UPI000F8D2B42|nr:glycosyltransferase [Georgenia sp. SYP-B2076]